MFSLITTFVFLIIETVLATFVTVRAWEYRPARLFVLMVAIIASLNIFGFFQAEATSVVMAAVGVIGGGLMLIILQILLLLLFSALFVPQWWTGFRPVIWISLPYVVAGIAFGVDAIAQTGLMLDGMFLDNGVYRLNVISPGGDMLRTLFFVSWFVHLGLLIVSFVRIPQARVVIGLLALTIAVSSTFNRFVDQSYLLRQISGSLSTLLLLLALAYMVLRTRFLVTTRVALDLALQAMHEAVVVLDRDGRLVYTNAQAERLGLGTQPAVTTALDRVGVDTSIIDLFTGGRAEWHSVTKKFDHARSSTMISELLTLNQRRIALTLTPVIDVHNRTQGMLVMGRDMTEIEAYMTRLEQERSHLVEAIRQLEAEKYERAKLAETVRTLSLPLIPILRGVLVLPLIGEFDSVRSADFMPHLLASIERERARLVFIDLTGIPVLDPVAATGLLRGVQAATLLGARCVLVGIRPDIAQTLVMLGIAFTGFKTAATLEQALSAELHQHPQWLPAMTNLPQRTR